MCWLAESYPNAPHVPTCLRSLQTSILLTSSHNTMKPLPLVGDIDLYRGTNPFGHSRTYGDSRVFPNPSPARTCWADWMVGLLIVLSFCLLLLFSFPGGCS